MNKSTMYYPKADFHSSLVRKKKSSQVDMTSAVCRICEGTADLQDLFDPEGADLIEKLTKCADVSVEATDELPKHICLHCRVNLEFAYNFRTQCEYTDRKLRDIAYLAKIGVNYEEKSSEDELQDEVNEEEYLVEDYDEAEGLTEEEITVNNSTVVQYEVETNISPLRDNTDIDNSVAEEEADEDDDHIIYILHDETSAEFEVISENDASKSPIPIKQERSHKRKLFQCHTCESSFLTFSELNQHKKVHGDHRYQCQICSKWFSKRYRLKNHMLIHNNPQIYPCSLCNNKYSHPGNLERHIRHFHKKERPYMCTVCGLSFSRSNILKVHRTVHINERNYECDICKKRFKAPYYLKVHMKSHIPATLRPKPRKVKNNDAVPKAPIICPYCGKKSGNKSLHNSHLRTHTGEKPFECKTCKKKFSFRQSLKSHELLHTGEKPYKCQFCPTSFRQIGHLKGHLLIHSGVRKHKCQYCDKAFTLKSNLVVHERLHTGETPYHCDMCTKKFHDSNALKRHKDTHIKILADVADMTGDEITLKQLSEYLPQEEKNSNEIVEIVLDNHVVKVDSY